MIENNHDPSLAERVAALERSNRSLLRCVAILLAFVAAMLCVAATPSKSKNGKFATLEAEQIIVRNGSGHELLIKGYDGVIDGVCIDLLKTDPLGKQIVLARLADFDSQGQLSVHTMDNSRQIMLDLGGITSSILPGAGKGPALYIHGDGPFVALHDQANRAAIVGSVQLVGGGGTELSRPASSITLFNGKQVVWSVP